MASDLSAFYKARDTVQRKRYNCWFSRLTPEQQETINDAHEAGFGAIIMSDVMKSEWGISLGKSIIGDHFSGRCSCDK